MTPKKFTSSMEMMIEQKILEINKETKKCRFAKSFACIMVSNFQQYPPTDAIISTIKSYCYDLPEEDQIKIVNGVIATLSVVMPSVYHEIQAELKRDHKLRGVKSS